MQIWRSLDEVPADLGRAVVTIGNFDGVHRGHQHVVRRAREVAAELAVDRVVAVTFDPHPIAVLRPDHAPAMLTDIAERARLLGEAGVDDVLVVPFTREIAGWSPEEFIDRILIDAMHARAVVVGANFRFGNRAAGDCNLLRRVGEELGRGAEPDRGFVVAEVTLDGGPQVWSSTYIRTCLASGDVTGAAEALGRTFGLRGTVAEGDRRGRDLGFPTANVPIPGGLAAPADGVYAGWLTVVEPDGPAAPSGQLPAAISVGSNPTFDGERERRVEAYVLDRTDLDLYGRVVRIDFVDLLRGMRRFDGIDELVAAMHDDVRRTRLLLG